MNRTGKPARASRKQSLRKSVSSCSELNFFDISLAEKPDHASIESLIPFLQEHITIKMPSDLKYLDPVLDYLNEWMLRFGIINPGDSEVLIALDEAIVNAIKHGNKCDSRKAVHIAIEYNSEGARFTITDEGAGFSKESVPDPTDPCRLLEPSGRGLLLITHIMDSVCHNQPGNRIEMFKRPANCSDAQDERADSPDDQQ